MAWFNIGPLSLKDLINIDQGRKDRSLNLKVIYLETYQYVKEDSLLQKILKFFKKNRLIYYKLIKYRVESDSGSKYTVLLEIPPDVNFDKLVKNKIRVFCSCSDFMYRAAYHLNKSDNLFKNKAVIEHLKLALDIKPTKVLTTPTCKHVFACVRDLATNYKKYNLV